MLREYRSSRSGDPTLLIDGRSVHSSYDPRREALRRAETLSIASTTTVIVVVGEGLPYLSTLIAESYPQCNVLSLLLGSPASPSNSHLDVIDTPPGTVRSWLRRRVHAWEAASIEVVSWEAGSRVAPTTVDQVHREILEAIRDLQAELATVGSFGMRWLSNSIRNAVLCDTQWTLEGEASDVLVMTSGPSAFPTAAEWTRLAAVLPVAATSSVVHLLRSRNVHADVVVHTDGGFWAARYLATRWTDPGDRAVLALPDRAALPAAAHRPSGASERTMFLATGSLSEELHLDAHRWPRVSEQPTVTATLFHLLDQLSPTATWHVAGLDLATYGLRSHAPPHAHDRVVTAATSRLRPEHTVRAGRVFGPGVRVDRWSDGTPAYRSAALEAFVSALRTEISTHRGAVRFLGSTPGRRVLLAETKRTEEPPNTGAIGSLRRTFTAVRRNRPPRRDRISHIAETLAGWREEVIAYREGSDAARCDSRCELLYQLAPVELLHAERGEGSRSVAAAAAERRIADLRRLLEHVDG